MKQYFSLVLMVICLPLLVACADVVEEEQMPELGLIEAAEKGDLATLKRLIETGVDLNQQDERGRTAAVAATHARQTEAVRLLIEAGADINLRDQRSDNVLLYAGAEGILPIVELAVEAGADTSLRNRYGGIAIIPAAERGHVEIVEFLATKSDTNVNHVNNLGWTALLEAIILSDGGPRHQQIVELLIANGADVNLADKDGVTPLQHARQRGYQQIISQLEAAGAR
jgi:ankyrin repeat protein